MISCPDQVGLVYKVTAFIAAQGGSLIEANNYTDRENGWFFMRLVISADTLACTLDKFRDQFSELAFELKMKWYIRDSEVKQKVVAGESCRTLFGRFVTPLAQWGVGL